MRPTFSPVIIERGDSRLVRQSTRTAAIAEAERLARAHPGKEFCVFVPVAIMRMPELPVEKTELRGDYEVDISF